MREDDARSSCRNFIVCVQGDGTVCGSVQLGATLRAVTAAINIANTARPGRTPDSGLNRYGTLSSHLSAPFPNFILSPRIPTRMSNRHCPPAHSPPPPVTDQSAERPKATPGVSSK